MHASGAQTDRSSDRTDTKRVDDSPAAATASASTAVATVDPTSQLQYRHLYDSSVSADPYHVVNVNTGVAGSGGGGDGDGDGGVDDAADYVFTQQALRVRTPIKDVHALSHRDHPLSKRERERIDRERIARDQNDFTLRKFHVSFPARPAGVVTEVLTEDEMRERLEAKTRRKTASDFTALWSAHTHQKKPKMRDMVPFDTTATNVDALKKAVKTLEQTRTPGPGSYTLPLMNTSGVRIPIRAPRPPPPNDYVLTKLFSDPGPGHYNVATSSNATAAHVSGYTFPRPPPKQSALHITRGTGGHHNAAKTHAADAYRGPGTYEPHRDYIHHTYPLSDAPVAAFSKIPRFVEPKTEDDAPYAPVSVPADSEPRKFRRITARSGHRHAHAQAAGTAGGSYGVSNAAVLASEDDRKVAASAAARAAALRHLNKPANSDTAAAGAGTGAGADSSAANGVVSASSAVTAPKLSDEQKRQRAYDDKIANLLSESLNARRRGPGAYQIRDPQPPAWKHKFSQTARFAYKPDENENARHISERNFDVLWLSDALAQRTAIKLQDVEATKARAAAAAAEDGGGIDLNVAGAMRATVASGPIIAMPDVEPERRETRIQQQHAERQLRQQKAQVASNRERVEHMDKMKDILQHKKPARRLEMSPSELARVWLTHLAAASRLMYWVGEVKRLRTDRHAVLVRDKQYHVLHRYWKVWRAKYRVTTRHKAGIIIRRTVYRHLLRRRAQQKAEAAKVIHSALLDTEKRRAMLHKAIAYKAKVGCVQNTWRKYYRLKLSNLFILDLQWRDLEAKLETQFNVKPEPSQAALQAAQRRANLMMSPRAIAAARAAAAAGMVPGGVIPAVAPSVTAALARSGLDDTKKKSKTVSFIRVPDAIRRKVILDDYTARKKKYQAAWAEHEQMDRYLTHLKPAVVAAPEAAAAAVSVRRASVAANTAAAAAAAAAAAGDANTAAAAAAAAADAAAAAAAAEIAAAEADAAAEHEREVENARLARPMFHALLETDRMFALIASGYAQIGSKQSRSTATGGSSGGGSGAAPNKPLPAAVRKRLMEAMAVLTKALNRERKAKLAAAAAGSTATATATTPASVPNDSKR